MLPIVQDRLLRRAQLRILAERMARVRVAVPAREAARGDLQADAVTHLEQVAGRPEINREAIWRPWLKQGLDQPVAIASANDAVGQVVGAPVGVHVDKTGNKIRVRR